MREALIRARNNKGLTQKQLAAAVNKSVRQYQNIEAGTSEPGVETAISIAELLGSSVTDLFSPAAATAEGKAHPDYTNSDRAGIDDAKELNEAAKGFDVDVETILDVAQDGRLDDPARRGRAQRLKTVLEAVL